jgi:hypothetical protein
MTSTIKRYPKRYIPNKLSKKDKKKQKMMINKSRKLYKKGIYYSRKSLKSFKSKPSPHILKAKRVYKINGNIIPNAELSKKTGCSISALKQIVKKGQGAYFSSGSRPNQSAHSWGYARLASSITAGKASRIDMSILEKGCSKTSKALRMARRSPYNKGTVRKTPKIK